MIKAYPNPWFRATFYSRTGINKVSACNSKASFAESAALHEWSKRHPGVDPYRFVLEGWSSVEAHDRGDTADLIECKDKQ